MFWLEVWGLPGRNSVACEHSNGCSTMRVALIVTQEVKYISVVVYSDLHNGFSEFSSPAVDVDLVILAGDIHVNTKGVDWAAKHFPDTRALRPGQARTLQNRLPQESGQDNDVRQLASIVKRFLCGI